MRVDFGAPAMLLGASLAVLPIVAHLIGYRARQRVTFPSLRLLRASDVEVRRSVRLRSLWLLLLRVLACFVIALLLARPTLSFTARAVGGVEPGLPTVVLLDRSASMRAEDGGRTRFEAARALAGEMLASLSPGTPAAVVPFDLRAEPLHAGLTGDRRALLAELEAVEAGYAAADLGRALRTGRELLADAGIADAAIAVLTDGKGTGLPAGFGAEWPASVRVHWHDLSANEFTNVFPDRVAVESGSGAGLQIEVDARRSAAGGDASSVRIRVDLPGGIELAGDAAFRGSIATRSFSVPLPPDGDGTLSVSTPPDRMPADDTLVGSLASDRAVSALLVSGEAGPSARDDEVYYLARALQPGGMSLSRIRTRVVAAEELHGLDGGRGDVVFLCNVADPRPLADSLTAFVERGGGVFISVGKAASAEAYASIAHLMPATLSEVKVRGAGTFEQNAIGFGPPPLQRDEFRVFREAGTPGFSRVRFGKVWGVQPELPDGADVLLRYSDGLPALLARSHGRGRVVLFTSTLDDDWTDLPLRPIFVPLMHQITRSLAGALALDSAAQIDVGQPAMLPAPPDPTTSTWVVGPDGTRSPVSAPPDADGRVRFDGSDRPGLYTLRWRGEGDPEDGVVRAVWSARIAAAESAMVDITEADLVTALPGIVLHRTREEAREADVRAERKASAMPPLLWGFGALLALEAYFAGRRR